VCAVVRRTDYALYPDGKVERVVTFPATQTSSLAFGGPDLDTIFVTSAGSAICLRKHHVDTIQTKCWLAEGSTG
jgi:sugar lactone lactonase YvrE